MAEKLIAFRGAVGCQPTTEFPGLALSGETAPGARVTLTFSAPAPAALPALLENAVVEELGGRQYRVSSAAGTWTIAARAVHLHREVATEFYRALPPRPVPLVRRALWRIVLALAASRAGVVLLRALRR